MKPCQEQFIFFGTSEFAKIILQSLLSHECKPLLIVTVPDKPAGRRQLLTPSPIRAFLQKEHPAMKILQPEKLDMAFEAVIRDAKPDFFVVAAYGEILSQSLLNLAVKGVLNVHPSLLPLYRGPSPIQSAILNGDAKTGVTIMLLDEKMDHGPILAQKEMPIKSDAYYPELHDELAKLGSELLLETIPPWISGALAPKPQDDRRATYTSIFRKEHGRIDWKKDALYIERQVRALQPWPGTFSMFHGQVLKILRARAIQVEDQKPPGTVIRSVSGHIGVSAGKGFLVLETVQIAGGRSMPVQEFILGHTNFINTIL